MLTSEQAFQNTSTNVAAAQMRNALTSLADSVDVEDPAQKKVGYMHNRHTGFSLRLTRLSNSSSKPRWTTSSPCSAATLTTRPKETQCTDKPHVDSISGTVAMTTE